MGLVQTAFFQRAESGTYCPFISTPAACGSESFQEVLSKGLHRISGLDCGSDSGVAWHQCRLWSVQPSGIRGLGPYSCCMGCACGNLYHSGASLAGGEERAQGKQEWSGWSCTTNAARFCSLGARRGLESAGFVRYQINSAIVYYVCFLFLVVHLFTPR